MSHTIALSMGECHSSGLVSWRRIRGTKVGFFLLTVMTVLTYSHQIVAASHFFLNAHSVSYHILFITVSWMSRPFFIEFTCVAAF